MPFHGQSEEGIFIMRWANEISALIKSQINLKEKIHHRHGYNQYVEISLAQWIDILNFDWLSQISIVGKVK